MPSGTSASLRPGRFGTRLRTWALPVVVLLGAATPMLDRQGPAPRGVAGRFEVDGFDFRPDGAWRRGTERIRGLRRRLLRAGNLSALNRAAGQPVTGAVAGNAVGGSYVVPVIPIAFSNVPPPFPAQQYQTVLFASTPVGEPYSVDDLAAQTGRPASDLLAELGELELAGKVQRVAGGSYARLD